MKFLHEKLGIIAEACENFDARAALNALKSGAGELRQNGGDWIQLLNCERCGVASTKPRFLKYIINLTQGIFTTNYKTA